MKYILTLIILISLVNLSSAASYNTGDIEWASVVSGTLTKGSPIVTNGNFTVKALEFPSPVPGIKDIDGNIIPETYVEPMVLVEIYRDNVIIKEALILNLQNEAYIDPDYEVKVSATGFPAKNAKEWVQEFYNPSATISIQLRGLPKIEVNVATDKNIYTSYDDQIITATVTVKNTGDAFAKNIDVNLNPGELKLRGGDKSQLHNYYYRMEKETSLTYDVIFVVPPLFDEKTYTLTADAKSMDAKEIKYMADTGILNITVSPKQNYFSISKSIRDRMYLQNTATVSVMVENSGMFDVYNIHVNDSLNEKFELRSNSSLHWEIPVLHPGQEWGTTYSVKPLEANLAGFVVPAVTAKFIVNNKPYSTSSTTTTVVVNGPNIQMNKTVDRSIVNISEIVNVTVIINNTGNIGTRIEVMDMLSDSVSLLSGHTSLVNWSEKFSTERFSYSIRMNKVGEIELPPAIANYTGVEYRGTTRSVLSSQEPVITVIDPSKITPLPTPEVNSTIKESVASTEVVAPQETPVTPTETLSFWQKLLNRIKAIKVEEPSPNETVVPTPTQITPGFETVFVIGVLLIAAVFRRR
ncbi:MAG: hypothetical protein J5U17_00805 [Candidatus Methanoperedens sp.]|nr:hypothetical protein [Candidatus Methanoperedens sp.]